MKKPQPPTIVIDVDDSGIVSVKMNFKVPGLTIVGLDHSEEIEQDEINFKLDDNRCIRTFITPGDLTAKARKAIVEGKAFDPDKDTDDAFDSLAVGVDRRQATLNEASDAELIDMYKRATANVGVDEHDDWVDMISGELMRRGLNDPNCED